MGPVGVPDAVFPTHIPANVSEKNSRRWLKSLGPATNVGDSDGNSASWLVNLAQSQL